jgi:predicted O-linked N-acetylglucosamine transferase (SPINDLY family)
MKIALFDMRWSYTITTPYTEPLGGTQSAICYFLEEMKVRGHTMYLFNDTKQLTTIRGIVHVPASQAYQYIAQNNLVFDLVIVSCMVNDLMEIKSTINNPNTLYSLWTGHDVDQPASKLLEYDKIKDTIDLFIFVSSWQQNRFIDMYKIPYNKTLVMRNGIGKPFECMMNLPSNKIRNSMTYCSIPWRGLELLQPIYKKIKEDNNTMQSTVTLKIFSGMNIYKQAENNDNKYDGFKTMEGVQYNYGIGQTQLANELYSIEYLTYPNIFQETSCITVLQAMAMGCIVVTSDLGALKETMGGLNFYINLNPHQFNAIQYIEEFTNKMNILMNSSDEMKEKLRQANIQHVKENYLWSVICEKFEKDVTKYIVSYKDYIEKEYKKLLLEATIQYSEKNFANALGLYNKILYFPNINELYLVKLNSGVCYFSLNNMDMAKKYFKICKDMKDDFNVNKNIAALEMQRGNIVKFLKYGHLALKHNFDIFLATLMAQTHEQEGEYHEAIGLYETVLTIDSENVNALNNLGNIYLLTISQLNDIDMKWKSTYWKSLELAIRNKENRKRDLVISNIIFNNLYNWKLSEEEIFNRALEYPKYVVKEESLQNITNNLNRKMEKRDKMQKLRIGYISTDFSTHPVGYMFESILKNHNSSRYEIFCYDNSSKGEEEYTAKRLRSYKNATWYRIDSMSDEDVLRTMINDNLDILVDMMGHTRMNRMSILQYKPARTMISYFAYPSTSGFVEMDYKFTDIHANPPETQKYFTESLYYLPNGFQCYTPPQPIELNKNYTRDPKYPIHLACFNNPIKLSHPTIETFAAVMRALPESKLFLRYCYYRSSFIRESILRLFEKYGVDRSRIDIGFDQLIDSLKQYNNIDIVLDPFPYNGGTISSEALYMGTPFITLAGTNYVSRVGVSLLNNVGLPELVANTKEEYVEKVVRLARDTTELKRLHSSLRDMMLKCDLANDKSFTLHIEEAYEDIVKKQIEKNK